MKTKRHSIKDIASKLNVSSTTVSFVLNGKAKEKRISDKVSNEILAYAKKINYKPNLLAQSLRTGKSKIIVFMVEDISNSFFARIARIIEDIAYDKGYKVLFCSNENEDKKSIEFINLFTELQVDGFIITPSAGIRDSIKKLLENNVPVVLFDRYFPDLNTNHIIIDNATSAYDATVHLIENGYKNIGFITTDVEQTQMTDRLKGYKGAIEEYGLDQLVMQMPYEGNRPVEKRKLIRTFFMKNKPIDAVFFATNYLTEMGLLVIKESFPDLMNKWGIVTFDDNEFFKIHTPSISAVSQPLFEIGKEVIELLLNILEGKKEGAPFKKIVLKGELQVRESSRPNIR